MILANIIYNVISLKLTVIFKSKPKQVVLFYWFWCDYDQKYFNQRVKVNVVFRVVYANLATSYLYNIIRNLTESQGVFFRPSEAIDGSENVEKIPDGCIHFVW